MKTKQLMLIAAFVFLLSCGENYTPKPRGYFRIEFPEKQYKKFQSNAPYSFFIPTYSKMVTDSSESAENWWYNLNFPEMKATLHLTYKQVNNNISEYIDDTRTLVNKHTIKADNIEPDIIKLKDKNVVAVLFEISGNAATPYQFFVTDSANHFLRGSLYFNVHPNKDSLAPAISFLEKDIRKLITSLEWKK